MTRALLSKTFEYALIKCGLCLAAPLEVHVISRSVDALPVLGELSRTLVLDPLEKLQAASSHLLAFVYALPWVLLFRIAKHKLFALVVAVLSKLVSSCSEWSRTEANLGNR